MFPYDVRKFTDSKTCSFLYKLKALCPQLLTHPALDADFTQECLLRDRFHKTQSSFSNSFICLEKIDISKNDGKM